MACDPANFPIKIRRGIHYGPLTVSCQDSNDDPVPLTGFSVFAVARPQLESPNEIDLEPAITNAVGGVITIDLDDETTNQFAVGDYVWDLVLQEPGGERIPPLLAGPLSVIDYVSRE
jgi:hypothetical protein